ncbi:hypothetical protein [Sulfurovum mangrovi]|uniref:hypothetical protein n=1 Tax=Sulfurovum mangrovi TaxID=2893889 RepID=UPI001E5301CE|nr:hypothetical protein [Sulfurovum mangrovi]UFH60261.1 hypothetical protein LN246_05280 [Sulfurovum mangrovi]
MTELNEKMINILTKISHLDDELYKLLFVSNNINGLSFIKIDNTLYYTNKKNDNTQIVGWYIENKENDKYKEVIFYVNNNPVSIYFYIDRNTDTLLEVEFLDWTGEVCSNECIDIALNSDIKIEWGNIIK